MKTFYLLLSLIAFVSLSKSQCAFTINPSNTPVTCFNGNNGTAAVNPTGGTGPYLYNWKSGNTSIGTNINITNLVAGTYKIIVTDQGAACSDSTNVTITQPTQLVISTYMTNPACMSTPNGGLCANVNGGTAPYTYMWTPTAINTSCMMGVPAGTYTVIATDANGCAVTATDVVQMDFITVSLNTTNTNCNSSNGSITSNVGGGFAPYTYTWSDGSTGPNIGTGIVGTYTLTVTDAMGCSITQTTTLNSSPWISSANITTVPAACGQNNGAVTVNSTQGSPATNYTFNGTNYNTTNTFTGYAAGSYNLQIADTGGCVYSTIVNISNSNFNTYLNATMPACNQCNGAISTSITGGSAPYTYQWSNNSVNANISSLCIGNYQVMVTDANGCISYADTNLYPVNAPQIITDTIINITCNGVTTGSATVHGTGGTSPYSYTWNSVPVQTTPTITTLTGGLYTVLVTDGAGCNVSKNVYIANANNIYLYTSNINNPNCSANGSATINTVNGTPPISYLWSNGSTGSTINGLAAGLYTVLATDANGCQAYGSVTMNNMCLNIIRGRLYDDANQNCVQDIGEQGIANKTIQTDTYHYATTNANGDFQFAIPQMTANILISPYYNLPYYSPTCPSNGVYTINFSAPGDTVNNANLGVVYNPNFVDVSLHPGWQNAHPGFQKKYWILFSNNSASAQNIMVRFTYDANLTVDSIRSPGIHYPAQHKIEWTYNNVPSGTQWNWSTNPEAYLHVPASMSINDSISSLFEIFPISGDSYPLDNVLDIREPITGSRDPNEKSVIPDGNILPSDSILFYTVHFQNNGNDTAYTVVVEDTLSQYLEPASVMPGASNHPYTFSLSGQNLMTFRFDHIMLPDSLTNEPESNGWFNYTVHLKPGLAPGTTIHNTAYIYFDFNSAVVTNTTTNTLVLLTSQNEISSDNSSVLIYPNPAKDALMIQYDVTKAETNMTAELYNSLGELVYSKKLNAHTTGKNLNYLDISKFNSGIYFLKLIDGTKLISKKVVIQH